MRHWPSLLRRRPRQSAEERQRRVLVRAIRQLPRDCRDVLRALMQRVEVISKTEARIIGSRTEPLRALASSDDESYAASGGVSVLNGSGAAQAAAVSTPGKNTASGSPSSDLACWIYLARRG